MKEKKKNTTTEVNVWCKLCKKHSLHIVELHSEEPIICSCGAMHGDIEVIPAEYVTSHHTHGAAILNEKAEGSEQSRNVHRPDYFEHDDFLIPFEAISFIKPHAIVIKVDSGSQELIVGTAVAGCVKAAYSNWRKKLL